MDQNNLAQNFSSILQTTLSSLRSPEFVKTTNELLCAVKQLSSISQLTELDNLTNSLSTVPLHPYQRLLKKHFDADYNFKTIDNVPEPEHIPVKECLNYISQREQEIYKTIFHNLTCSPQQQLTTNYEFLSGNKVVCDLEKQKKYLEFFEMVRQIPVDSITPENTNIIIKKIISEYIKVI